MVGHEGPPRYRCRKSAPNPEDLTRFKNRMLLVRPVLVAGLSGRRFPERADRSGWDRRSRTAGRPSPPWWGSFVARLRSRGVEAGAGQGVVAGQGPKRDGVSVAVVAGRRPALFAVQGRAWRIRAAVAPWAGSVVTACSAQDL